jgi:hypothetical protein
LKKGKKLFLAGKMPSFTHSWIDNGLKFFNFLQAVEMLRSTGRSVQLKLVRYLHGFKFEQLQQAIANSTNPLAYSSNTLGYSGSKSNSINNILQQQQQEEEEEEEELPPVPPVI